MGPSCTYKYYNRSGFYSHVTCISQDPNPFMKTQNAVRLTIMWKVWLTVGRSAGSHSMWPWGFSCLHGAKSTVELQLTYSCTQTHMHQAKPGRGHMMSVVSRVLFSCVPRSPRQGRTDHAGPCARLWRTSSSSCQISAWTWNLQPPAGRHAQSRTNRKVSFPRLALHTFPLPSCRSTCLVVWPTLCRVNRCVESDMELYMAMEKERGTFRSSEFSSISTGQPMQGAFSGMMWSSGEEEDYETGKRVESKRRECRRFVAQGVWHSVISLMLDKLMRWPGGGGLDGKMSHNLWNKGSSCWRRLCVLDILLFF